jgi:hypothetical protein
VGAVQLIVNDLSAALLVPIVGAFGVVFDHDITQPGLDVVTPVTELRILQIKVLVPVTLPPVNVVEEADGELIVQVTPLTVHAYDNVPPFVLLPEAVMTVVVALRANVIAVVEIPVRKDDMTRPKNPDIYFILFKVKINVTKYRK